LTQPQIFWKRIQILRLIENMTLGRNAVGYLTESTRGAGSPQAQRFQIACAMQVEFKKDLAKALPASAPASACRLAPYLTRDDTTDLASLFDVGTTFGAGDLRQHLGAPEIVVDRWLFQALIDR
jgi:hypothetical protein